MLALTNIDLNVVTLQKTQQQYTCEYIKITSEYRQSQT